MRTTQEILRCAKAASRSLSALTTQQKNEALSAMADSLLAHTDAILAANRADVATAEGRISSVMIDRLTLTAARIEGMAQGIREVAALPDPVGRRPQQGDDHPQDCRADRRGGDYL